MRTTTLGDYMSVVLLEKTASTALIQTAQAWLDVDRVFTMWIHESAKKRLGEDEMLSLAESEEAGEKQAVIAWKTYEATRSQANESALIEALDGMIEVRRRSMEGSFGIV